MIALYTTERIGLYSVTLLLLLFFLTTPLSAASLPPAREDPNSWYYCGKDPNGPTPQIPPLVTSKLVSLVQGAISLTSKQVFSFLLKCLTPSLLHFLRTQVATVIRHGDRTGFVWYPVPGSLGTKKMCCVCKLSFIHHLPSLLHLHSFFRAR